MIKSIFLDIDGTLVSFKTHQIPQSTIEALTAAKESGVGIYISTGRPRQIITNLGAISHLIDGYITTNGAMCIVDNKIIRKCPIDRKEVEIQIEDAIRNDYCCLITGERNMAVLNRKEAFDRIFLRDLNVKGIDTDFPVEEVLKQDIYQFSPFIDAAHESILMSRMTNCVSGRWHPEFTDITDIKAEKGKGLAAMAEHLNLDISETMAFGDGGNDISIIKASGIGVAMGNAGDSVKAEADYVTTGVDDDGIRNALLHFGIIRTA